MLQQTKLSEVQGCQQQQMPCSPRTDPCIPPPPPPPPPFLNSINISVTRSGSNSSLGQNTPPTSNVPSPLPNHPFTQFETPKPRTKMRTLNWNKIPVHKIVSTVRPNIWSLVATSNDYTKPDNKDFDFETLEDLFCQPNPGSAPNSCPGSPRLPRRAVVACDGSSSPYNSLERKILMKFNGENNYQTEVNVLDGKKALNINIFLKQYRGSIDELISRVRDADHRFIGTERLRNLLKILPEKHESEALTKQKHNVHRMPIAERFLLQLIEVENYQLKIEYMLLKDEFESNTACLQPSIDIINNAAQEIQNSKRLRDIFYIILVSGNFLNSGGYAGDAVGFKLTSLLKLAEIRANKPGISFIHFVAEEAEKRNLHNFIEELPNLEEALKISVESLKSEIDMISSKISRIKAQLRECCSESAFYKKINDFLTGSEQQVSQLSNNVYYELENTRINLAEFLCEEPQKFKLEECFRILVLFSQRLKNAFEENKKRKENELKMEARKIKNNDLIAVKSESENYGNDQSASVLLNNKLQKKQREKMTDDELSCDLVELLNSASEISSDCLFGSFRRVGSGRRSRPVSANLGLRERTFSDTNNENRGQRSDPTTRQSWTEESFSHRRKADGLFKEISENINSNGGIQFNGSNNVLRENVALDLPFQKHSEKSANNIENNSGGHRLNIQLNPVKNSYSEIVSNSDCAEKEAERGCTNANVSRLQETDCFNSEVSQKVMNVHNIMNQTNHHPYRCAVISPTTVKREDFETVKKINEESVSSTLLRSKPTAPAISAIVRPLNVTATNSKTRADIAAIKVSRSKLPVRDNSLTTLPQQRKQPSDLSNSSDGSINRSTITSRASRTITNRKETTHANTKSMNVQRGANQALKTTSSQRTIVKNSSVTPKPRQSLSSGRQTKGFMRPTSSSNAKRL